MKSSIKLSLAFALSVSLFLTCSLLFLNAEADASMQKLKMGNNLIRMQTSLGKLMVDIQLLENTDHCLTDCYAVLRIHPYQDIILPSNTNSDFSWRFEKEKPWMDDLVSYHFELLETTDYTVDVPDYGKKLVDSICYHKDNSTYECEVEQTVQTSSHQETRYESEFKPFAFWGETLKADQDYTLKLIGKKRPHLGTNNIEWILTIKGFELNEWSSWNSSCFSRQLIVSNATATGIINLNDTNWPNLWTKNASATTGNIYLYNCTPYYYVVNDSDQMSWENGTSRTGYNPTSLWQTNRVVLHIDEGTGTQANDSTSIGLNGVFSSVPSWNSTNCIFGSCLTFDGSDDWLSIGNNLAYDNFSVEIWAYAHTKTEQGIFGHSPKYAADMNVSFGLYMNSAGNIAFYVDSDGRWGPDNWAETSSNPTLNQWHQYVGVYDKTNKILRLYVDGILNATNATNNWVSPFTTGLVQSYVGGDTVAATPWDGNLDEFRFYNVSLTSNEIADHCNNGINNLTLLGNEISCPPDDTYVNENAEFGLSYQFCDVSDGGAQGVLIINASNVIVNCNGMTLNGTGSGVGIYNRGFHNVTLQNCRVQNYASDVLFNNELVAEVITAASAYG